MVLDNLNRRQFCLGSAVALSSAALPFGSVQARKHQIGQAVITSFSDGIMRVPTSMLFNVEDAPEIQPLLEKTGMAEGQAARPLNITLLEIGDKTILFDAGSGPHFLPGLGKLPSELEAAGIDISAVTDIVFTHAHPDHLWGVLDEFDDLIASDANYHMSSVEWNFWNSDAALQSMPAGREAFAVGAKSRFEILEDRINLFEFGDEILPGVEAIDSSGHTPGHTAFGLYQQGKTALILGDALTHPLISFAYPEVQNHSDMDNDKAIRSRKMLLDKAATDKAVILGYHLPAPGLGLVEKKEGRFQYLPV